MVNYGKSIHMTMGKEGGNWKNAVQKYCGKLWRHILLVTYKALKAWSNAHVLCMHRVYSPLPGNQWSLKASLRANLLTKKHWKRKRNKEKQKNSQLLQPCSLGLGVTHKPQATAHFVGTKQPYTIFHVIRRHTFKESNTIIILQAKMHWKSELFVPPESQSHIHTQKKKWMNEGNCCSVLFLQLMCNWS